MTVLHSVKRAVGADAIEILHAYTPDVVLVDLQLPVMDGRSFIDLYRRRVRPAASVVVMSGRTDGSAIASELLRTLALALAVG